MKMRRRRRTGMASAVPVGRLIDLPHIAEVVGPILPDGEGRSTAAD